MIDSTFAVVVNWNGGEANVSCVASLLAQGLAEEHIVFVDNGSTDGSRERVARAFPNVVVEANATNRGYGDGTNQGIERARERGARFVFLVNNDLTLPEGTLARLLEYLAAHADVGIVGPRVLYRSEPGLVWCAGGRITFRQNLSEMIGHRRPDGPEYREVREVDYVPGCAMLVRSEVFERAGLLDGDYFAYHEDVEFCMHAKEAGFRTVLVGDAAAHHDAHSSTGGGYNPRRKYMMGVNTVWFLRRHGTPARWASFFVFDVLSLPFVLAYRAARGEGGAVVAKARGMLDGLRGRRVSNAAVDDERWG